MDFLDLLGLAALPTGGRNAPDSPGEALTYGLATFVVPVALFALVLFAGIWAHPVAALAVGAGGLALTVLVARLLSVGTAQTLRAVIACAISCFFWGGAAFLLAVFASFFSSF